MKFTVLLMAVGCGGAIGAVARHLLAYLFHSIMNLHEYVAIMIVNISGCFLIGMTFFLLEALLKKDRVSPLKNSSLSKPLLEKGWWPEEDPTQPVIRDFKTDLRSELIAAFIITGILGGMTTFSLFSLISLNLEQSGNHISMLINVIGSLVAGWIATYFGLMFGREIVFKYQNL